MSAEPSPPSASSGIPRFYTWEWVRWELQAPAARHSPGTGFGRLSLIFSGMRAPLVPTDVWCWSQRAPGAAGRAVPGHFLLIVTPKPEPCSWGNSHLLIPSIFPEKSAQSGALRAPGLPETPRETRNVPVGPRGFTCAANSRSHSSFFCQRKGTGPAGLAQVQLGEFYSPSGALRSVAAVTGAGGCWGCRGEVNSGGSRPCQLVKSQHLQVPSEAFIHY